MRRKIYIAILIIMAVFMLDVPGVSAAGEVNGTLRVRLSVDTPEDRLSSISFTIDGNYVVEGNDSVKLERKQYTVKNQSGKLYLYYGSSKLCGGDISLRLAQLSATEGLNNVIILYNKIHNKNFGYLGDIQFLADSKYVQVINHIYIEDYLYGVVPYEMSDSFPQQALRAQAVAARNYAAKRLGSKGNWDITDDSSKDQVYKGFSSSAVNSIEAVDSTKGQVLISGTTMIDAFYSASNGGWTDLPYHRWGGGADWTYYRIDYDPYDIANPSSRYETITIPVVLDSEHPITASHSSDISGTINSDNAIKLIKKAILDSKQLDSYNVNSVDDITPAGDDGITTAGDDDITPAGDDDITPAGDDDITTAGDDDITTAGDDDITTAGDDDITTAGDDDITTAGDDGITTAGDDDITAMGIDDFTLTGVIDLYTHTYDTDSGQDHSLTQNFDHTDDPDLPDPNLCMDKVRAMGAFTVSVNGTPVTVTGIDFDLRALKSNGSYPAFFSASLGLFVVEPVYDGEGALTAFNLSMRRFGHALGLSQRGAQQRAKPAEEGGGGQTYQEILSFYYPNTTLETRNYRRLATHTVMFETNGGNTKERLAIRTGSYIYAVPTATKTGYTLEGWYLDPELTDKITFPYMVTEDVTLYANWEITTYTISYDLVGGRLAEGYENPPSYTMVTEEFTLNNPTRAGYVFAGWTGTGLSAEAQTVTVPAGSYGNRSYKANWNGIVPAITSAVSTGYNSVSIAWSEAEGAVGYEVLRATSSGGTYSVVSGTTPLTEMAFAQTGLKAGTTYYYKVRGLFNDGEAVVAGVLSAYKSVKPVPNPPESVTAGPLDYDSIKVSWSSAPGASGYMVYRSTSENGSYSRITTTSRTYYTNNSLRTGTAYYYKVRAYRSSTSICGGYSPAATAVTALMPMKNVTAATYYPTSIKISWQAVPGRTRYEIWRSPTGEDNTFTRIATTTRTYYKNTGLTVDQTYYYKVRAYRTVNRKPVYNDYSGVVSDKARVFQVKNPKAAMYSVTSNKITWSSVTGASGYEVSRCDAEGNVTSALPATRYTYFYDKTIDAGVTYYYKVRAYRNVNTAAGTERRYGEYSGLYTCVSKVAGIKAYMYSVNSNRISWSSVVSRTGYEVYWAESPEGPFTNKLTPEDKPYTSTYIYHKNTDKNKTYYYKVLAYQTVGGVRKESGFSDTAIVVNKVAGAKAVCYSYSSNKITWNSVAGRTAYEVWRCDADGNVEPGALPLKITGYTYYTHTGLITDDTYYYKICAYQMIGIDKIYCNFSDVVSAKPQLKSVTGATTYKYSSSKIKLTWYSVPGATGYEIERCTTGKTEDFAALTTTASRYYYNSGLTKGTKYYYRIRAYRIVGEKRCYGGWSKTVSRTP